MERVSEMPDERKSVFRISPPGRLKRPESQTDVEETDIFHVGL